jgi:hypothetical protein
VTGNPVFDPADYPPALPHESILEIFPDVYLVHGSAKIGPGMRMNRNMIVVRQDGDLTVIGPVRLSSAAERQLDSLGKVNQVMRLGYYHGIDDRYYVERYGAEFWCQRGSYRYPAPEPSRLIEAGTAPPIADAEFFLFKEGKFPEAAVLLKRHGGILMTCDSLQHWTDWSFCTLPAKWVMRLFGFSLRTLIGTFWLKAMTPRGGSLKADFVRLLKSDFKHLIGAHGRLCRERAHEQVEAEVRHVFGSTGV